MDSIFLIDERARANLFQHILHSFACTTSYICLWSYLQPSNCLLFMDGFYHEENEQPGFSSRARILFDQYRQSAFTVNGRVPGLAFKNSRPYIEMKDADLLSLASIESQLQFYQEARIKTAIFMGCKTGEIELGMSNGTQVNMEDEMKMWFLEDLTRLPLPREVPLGTNQTRPSSSSSSLRSTPSMDSTAECPPFLYTTSNPNTSYIPKEAPNIEQALRPFISTTSTTTSPRGQAIQALSQIRSINQFPAIESEVDAAMTKAILAVMSSPSPSPSSSLSSSSHRSAFRKYRSVLAPTTTHLTTNLQKQNMLKRTITFFRGIRFIMQNQEHGSRPPSSQLHHMISERKRREKLNESFQALRSLLPPGSKKDKASVLITTMEYMSSLKTQVEELSRRNQLLETQIFPAKEVDREETNANGYSNVRLDVQVTNIAESESEERMVDLRVILKAECELLDFTIRIMEFLKFAKNVSLMSLEAETRMVESSPIKRVMLKLKIQGSDWDESAFQDAVRRVVADLAQ